MATQLLVLIEVDEDLGSDTEDWTGDLNLLDRELIVKAIGYGLQEHTQHLTPNRIDVEGVDGVTRESILKEVTGLTITGRQPNPPQERA